MPEDKQQDIMDTENVSEVEEKNPTASPDADAVKAYLAQKAAKEEEEAQQTAESLLSGKPEESEQEDEEEKPQQEERINLKYTSDFDTNEMDIIEQQSITINTQDIPVTHEDEVAYLKSMLNDTPFEIDISLYGGQMLIHARAVSVYEQQLAAVAAFNETVNTENGGLAAILAPTFMQKVRIALQLRTCNGLLVSDMEFKPEPNKLKEHVKLLTEKADEILGSTSAARWNAYVYALNIFEHKLTKLNEMALNRDFLKPGD